MASINAESEFFELNSICPPADTPLRISRFRMDVSRVPVDFLADPDGDWEFDSLVEAAGFDPENPGVCIGALTQAFKGFPEGSAVVSAVGRGAGFVALVEYPPELARSAGLPVLPQASPASFAA